MNLPQILSVAMILIWQYYLVRKVLGFKIQIVFFAWILLKQQQQ